MNNPSSDRQHALDRIAEIARAQRLSTDEIVGHLERARDGGAQRDGERLIRKILAYLGAVFVLAGAITGANLYWGQLGSAARVVASLGSGIAALVLAVATLRDNRFEVATTPLFLVAALLQTAGLFVFLDEYFDGDDPALGAMAVFGVMTLQSLLLFASSRRTELVFLSMLFGPALLASTLAWLETDAGFAALAIGVPGLTAGWIINASRYRSVAPPAFLVFGLLIAFGAFDLVEGKFPLDFGLVGVAAVIIYTGVVGRSRSLLATGVMAMLAYLGYFTREYFADMLSWPVALIVMGMLMLGLSSYALKLGRGMRDRD